MKGRLLALCLICLLLAGCGSKERVGLCLAGQDTDAAWMEEALEKAGYQVTAVHAGLDQGLQNRQAEELLEDCDLLLLEPVMAREMDALVAMAEQAGVPMLFTGKEPREGTAYVGLSSAQAAGVQSQLAASLPGVDLNGDGVICYAIIAGPEEDLDALAMEESCKEAWQETCLEVYYSDWTREGGKLGTMKALATWGKDLEVVLCQSSDLSKGAMEAIAYGGRTVGEDIFLVSMGQGQMEKLLVKSGDLSGTVVPDEADLKQRLLDAVALLLDGKPAQTQYDGYIAITRENVENYLD